MLGGLKNLANMASLMGQAGDFQSKMAEAKERVSRLELHGTAGGDAVRVRMTGDFRVLDVVIHEWLIEARDQQLSQRLVSEAMNDAIQRVKEATTREMSDIVGGMNIPGLQEAMARMGM